MVAGRGLESFDVEPDLMIFAKGLGNGLPIAAVGGPADVMDSLGAGSISTFGGNHLVTTGALANVRYLLAEGTQANAAVQGERMRDVTERLAASHPHIIGEVRGKGLMQAIEFTDPDEKHTPVPMWPVTSKRPAGGVGCSSAKAASIGTYCGSRRRSSSPKTKSTKPWES